MEEYIKEIKARHRLRDPIYGFVFLTDSEREIIDTDLFQRLRRIHQLALTKYVYPSAEHSRFVHSIGVMHCATLILAGIHEHKLSYLSSAPNDRQIKTLRYAALLHDIGHLPFSHAVEKQWLQGLKHEDLSQYIIEHYTPISRIMEQDGVRPKEVASLLAKKPPAKYRLLHEIISGHLDADRADYLLRDSHSCGVRYGKYDYPRFLQIFAAAEHEDTGHLSLMVDESDLHVAESLLIARYHYNLQIPYHRTRSGYDFALMRFIRDFPEYKSPFTVKNNQLTSVSFDQLEDLDDYAILEKAKSERKSGNLWAEYLLRKKHLIPIVDATSTSAKGTRIFKALVRKFGETPSFSADDDFFVQDREVEIIKWGTKADASKSADHKGAIPRYVIMLQSKEGSGRSSEKVDISERSWVFKHLTQNDPLRICRVYVTPEREREARAILSDIEASDKGESHEQ